MKKLVKTAILTAAFTAAIPAIAFARGEAAAINKNDTTISSMTDRTNSRADSWSSSPRSASWNQNNQPNKTVDPDTGRVYNDNVKDPAKSKTYRDGAYQDNSYKSHKARR